VANTSAKRNHSLSSLPYDRFRSKGQGQGKGKGKVKVHPRTGHEGPKEE